MGERVEELVVSDDAFKDIKGIRSCDFDSAPFLDLGRFELNWKKKVLIGAGLVYPVIWIGKYAALVYTTYSSLK